jgi:phosphopantothenate synthetase
LLFISYINVGRTPCHDEWIIMADAKKREVAESVFQRNERREAEINDALKQEEARHVAVLKNMQRLRALRLSRDGKSSAEQGP